MVGRYYARRLVEGFDSPPRYEKSDSQLIKKPVEIVKGFISPGNIYPLKGRVLIEAVFPEQSRGFFMPTEFERYSPLGRVVRGGDEEYLKPGNFVILRDEGEEYDGSYYTVFKLVLNDEGKEFPIIVDSEAEPLLRERIRAFQSNPATQNRELSVEDLSSGEWYTFLCSDVLDWTFDEIAHRSWDMELIPTFMINLWDDREGVFKLHYIAHTNSILATIGG